MKKISLWMAVAVVAGLMTGCCAFKGKCSKGKDGDACSAKTEKTCEKSKDAKSKCCKSKAKECKKEASSDK